MYYLFEKAWKRFFTNRKKYLFLIIQIAIGVCMIAVSLNINFAFHEQFSVYTQEMNNQYISISAGEMFGSSPDALSSEDNKKIQAEFKEEKERISYYKQYEIVLQSGDDFLPILFVDSNFYPMVMKAENYNSESVYIGYKVREYIDYYMLSQNKHSYGYFDVDEGKIFGVPLSSMIPMTELKYESKALLEDGLVANVLGAIDFENYIILPISIYEELDKQPACINNLAISVEEDNSDDKLTYDILKILQGKNEGDNFRVVNFYNLTEESLSRDIKISELLNYLSAFILIVVILGFMGLLLIIINQRKKEFAIALMCGATQKQLIQELFIEILLVVMIGVLVGNTFSLLFILFLGNDINNTGYYAQTFLILAAGGVMLSALVCIASLAKIKHLSPIRILKNL